MPEPQSTPATPGSPGLVWDLPTRFLHWSIAGLFLGAFVLAVTGSEHSSLFLSHAALGLILGFAVLLRILWGLWGSRPSRFKNFLFSPLQVFRYLGAALKGKDRSYGGHNPGASYGIFAMLLLILGIVATGIALGRGVRGAEELHGVLAYALMAVVGLHLAGLAWHAVRHRENLAMSMVDGKRREPGADAIPSARPWAGLAVLLLLGTWGMSVLRGFDAGKRQIVLPGLGTPLVLGESDTAGHREADHGEDD